jgi:hypothetical protein
MEKRMLLIIILSSFCSHRDLSTPSKKLVGHWLYEDGTHIYFDTINSYTKSGSYMFVDKDSVAHYFHHKILSETLDGNKIEVQREWLNEVCSLRTTYIISPDGTKLTERYLQKDALNMKYVPSVASSIKEMKQNLREANIRVQIARLNEGMEIDYNSLSKDTEQEVYRRWLNQTAKPHYTLKQMQRIRQMILDSISVLENKEAKLRNLDTASVEVYARYIDANTKPE